MAYYYVPIEQIKKGSNIKSIENYIGPYPYYNDCTYNRVKDGFYDLCLIVEVDKEDSLTAQEVMTGRQIPIVDMHLDSSGYIDFARNSIDGVHTYIRNVIRKVKICNGYFEMEESTAFNETTNLEMLDFPKGLIV